jgi:hypothetical protein
MQRRARRQQLGPHYLSFLTVVLQSEGRQLCAQFRTHALHKAEEDRSGSDHHWVWLIPLAL